MSKHAVLSPSSAERWIACPPSARLNEMFPETESKAAEEGTVAHSLGEILLRMEIDKKGSKKYAFELSKLEKSEYYNPEMLEYVTGYKNFVMEQFKAAQLVTKDAELILEDRLDLTKWVKEGFGTADAQIIADRELEIIDLKYGLGVKVEAPENKQMMLYALGAVEKAKLFYDIKTIKMTIYQPRLNNVSSHRISVSDLYGFANDELRPKAELAYLGQGDFCVGEHCRFCKAKIKCRAYAEEQKKILDYDNQEAYLLSDKEIAEIVKAADAVSKWLKDIQEYALNQAMNGVRFEGLKLIRNSGKRKYTDEEAVLERLKENGYDEALLTERKLLGITAMEKAITKKKFKELLSDLVETTEGLPKLVEEDDPRPEWRKIDEALNDFKDISL